MLHFSGKPYLGYVDKIGVSFTDKSVATGFGSYIAQPMMRKAMEGWFTLLDSSHPHFAYIYILIVITSI